MRTMVFKILGTSKSYSGIAYNEKKAKQGSAEMFYHENFGYLVGMNTITKEDFKNYLIGHSSSNTRVRKPQFHATISSKGKEHDFEDLKKVALQIMYELGYKGNPILIYSHSDTVNNHLHIISSRVDIHGKKINDSKEGIRAGEMLNNILGLNIDLEFRNAIEYAKGYSVSTHAQFALLVEAKGFKAIKNTEGYSFHKNGREIGGVSFEQIALNKDLIFVNKNRILQIKALIHKYKNQYSPVMKQGKKWTPREGKIDGGFMGYLKSHLKLEFIFFHDPSGKPYGYSIIDHNSKLVLKGSDVMKLDKLLEGQGAKAGIQENEEKRSNIKNENNFSFEHTPEGESKETISGSLADAEVSGLQTVEPNFIRKKKKKRLRLGL
jgi:hypothetical protein